jgi:CheY-like chemotaxis protein
MSRILIAEDEAHIANGLKFNLEAEGHVVEVVGDGETALQLLLGDAVESKQISDFDAMVLDVMLPGKDGFAVAAELRAAKNFIPLLMLTARGRPEDVLKGFAAGADDYLPGCKACCAAGSGCHTLQSGAMRTAFNRRNPRNMEFFLSTGEPSISESWNCMRMEIRFD